MPGAKPTAWPAAAAPDAVSAAAVATDDVGSRDSAGKRAGMEGGRVPLLAADALPASESLGSGSDAQQGPLRLSVDRASTSSNV